MEPSKVIFAGLGLVILAVGLFALLNLTQSTQNIKSKAADDGVNIEIISPRASSKILGLTNMRATVSTNKDPVSLRATYQIDGTNGQSLEIEKLAEGKISISGKLDSSKLTPGLHKLEIFLYDLSTPPVLLGRKEISVSVVTP